MFIAAHFFSLVASIRWWSNSTTSKSVRKMFVLQRQVALDDSMLNLVCFWLFWYRLSYPFCSSLALFARFMIQKNSILTSFLRSSSDLKNYCLIMSRVTCDYFLITRLNSYSVIIWLPSFFEKTISLSFWNISSTEFSIVAEACLSYHLFIVFYQIECTMFLTELTAR